MRRAQNIQAVGVLAVLAVGAMAFTLAPKPGMAQRAELAGVVVPTSSTETLSPDAFERLHRAVAPTGERWMDIPWETDLKAARDRAEREKKPLFMWVMDGHPLGCT